MSNLDLYLRSLARFGATGVILKSGANVTLRFPAGDRHATQTTTHEQLQQMIGAAAPDAARSSIVSGKPAGFDYDFEGQNYRVEVKPEGNTWTVEIDAKPAESTRGGDDLIERTSYAPTGDVAPGPGLPIERHSYDSVQRPGKADVAPSAATPASPASPPHGETPAPQASSSTPSAGSGERDEGIKGSDWIDKILHTMISMDASDLHLCTGCKPYVRASGHMSTLEDYPILDADFLMNELADIAPDKNKGEFEERMDTDFAYAVPGLSRFRVNMFMDRKGPGTVMRQIPFEIPSAEKLGIPKGCLELCKLTKGLVLVTGPTGSGKSTTLAAMIDYINDTRSEHIITIEDPVEFVHQNKKCLVNQREVHTHTMSFKNALRAALREDPDIVLVGEMRDLETIAIAVETAETGHLVFGTLHTSTAPSTVDRIIDQFPADRQEQIRQMLSESLKGVIAQVLCRKKGGGRVAAHEILIGTSAVSNIIREKKTFQLFSLMQTGRNQGMQTLNDALIDLVKRDLVEPNEAYMKAVNKAEFKTLLTRAGHSV